MEISTIRPVLTTLPALTGLMLVLAGCEKSHTGDGAGSPAGLATVVDSTADSVFARIAGQFPAAGVRSLQEELRIAPGASDTSLFTEVFEFDVDQSGRFWVYDRSSNSILLFGAAGELQRRIGRQGAGPGEFNQNNGMVALGDSGLAVLDSRNARISFFDGEGRLKTGWVIPAGFSTSNGLVADRSGTLYLRRPVTPPREGEILGRMGLVRLGDGGAFRDSLAPPDLKIPREVYVATRIQGKDSRSQSSTSSRYAPGYLWSWHPDGYFIVADGGKYEIIAQRPAALPLVIRRELPPVQVEQDEIEEERAQILWQMRQTDPGWTWSGPAIPSTKAPLMSLLVTRDGRLWCRIAVPSERIAEEELAASGPDQRPTTRYRTPIVYEVFAPDGRFLGRVEFPRRTALIEAEGNVVWALALDLDDLPAVTRFRVTPAFN
jgi:hypothetical protein